MATGGLSFPYHRRLLRFCRMVLDRVVAIEMAADGDGRW